MSSYVLVKVRNYPEGENGFLIEYWFGVESYSKYHSRLSVYFQRIDEAWNEDKKDFDDYENIIVYGLEQAREHRRELIATGKYSPEEIIIEKTDVSYLTE